MKRKSLRQCALVTGGSKRIGKAISIKLAEMGYDIAIHYNNSKKEARDLSNELKEKGAEADIFSCDLNDRDQTKNLIPSVVKRFLNLSVLVNNASMFKPDSLLTATTNQLEQHFQIHVETPFLLTQTFAKICKKGLIINILDTNITKSSTKHFTYLLSKKNLLNLTTMSAVELAPHIRVNGIAPGLILPPEEKSAEYLNRLAKKVPLKRKGSVDNITQTIQFLIENDYLTGQVIFADGGEHLL
ncbi:MAG: SDR family oxidoreductase [Candidatus Omnitrophica bacterium]|nr:SDR family oxidoreductase [Candidatus Omnitrophota bacterium]